MTKTLSITLDGRTAIINLEERDLVMMRDAPTAFAESILTPAVAVLANGIEGLPPAEVLHIPLSEAPAHIREMLGRIDLDKSDAPESLKTAIRDLTQKKAN